MEEILLSIDVFDQTCLSGWCAKKIGNLVISHPIMLEMGGAGRIIRNFHKREDLVQNGLGDGILAFNVKSSIAPGDTVRISDPQSGTRLWEGKLFCDFERFIRVPMTTAISIVENPENCLCLNILQSITVGGVDNTRFTIFRTNILANTGRIYYFQVFDFPEIIQSLEIGYNGNKFYKNIFCQSANRLLAEFWGYVPATFQEDRIGLKIKCMGQAAKCDASCVTPQRNIAFIASSGERNWLRSLDYDDRGEFDGVYISYPGDVAFEEAEVNLPSMLACREGGIIWQNGYVQGGYLKSGWRKKNIVNNPTMLHKGVRPGRKNIQYYYNVYSNYGEKALIMSLYINMLERKADKDGLNNMLSAFQELLKDNDAITAIENCIDIIKKSVEYKNLMKNNIFKNW